MLRITLSNDNARRPVIKVEGKLLAAWVGDLETACRAAQDGHEQLRLDLSGVSFADASGIIVLRELIQQGITIISTSPFIGELLRSEP